MYTIICPKCKRAGLPSIHSDLCTNCENIKRGLGRSYSYPYPVIVIEQSGNTNDIDRMEKGGRWNNESNE